MQTKRLEDILKANSYPGRGIVIGKSQDARCAVAAYFIMGRSENSRNRIFEADGEGIRTKAFDESKMVDPSLIIYSPVRVLGDATIVTNGDQTDTVYEYLRQSGTFEDALMTRTFEPDGPNFTPRISGLLEPDKDRYKLSILKSVSGDDSSVQRFFFNYGSPLAGRGHFIHTYKGDGNPLPSFEGEPEEIFIEGDIDGFTQMLWESLNNDNKVSLFVRFIDLESRKVETRIVNKHS